MSEDIDGVQWRFRGRDGDQSFVGRIRATRAEAEVDARRYGRRCAGAGFTYSIESRRVLPWVPAGAGQEGGPKR